MSSRPDWQCRQADCVTGRVDEWTTGETRADWRVEEGHGGSTGCQVNRRWVGSGHSVDAGRLTGTYWLHT